MTSSIEYRPSEVQRMFVEDESQLQSLVERLAQEDAIGVDLEMGQRVIRKPGGQQEWTHIMALVQLASSGLSVVIDPLRCRDLSPLAPLLAGPVRKVFLGGGQDAALLASAGMPARTVVDVGEVALGLFGRREDGMAALADRILGISLDKSVRRADWLGRPLNPVLLAYAHRDAELTLLIYRWFKDHYPAVVKAHERDELDPGLPPASPIWLREAMRRSNADVMAIVMEHGLSAEAQRGALARDVADVLSQSPSPRQVNRLLRIASDLSLIDVVPQALGLVDSPSSMVRGAAARALGQLSTLETALEPLDRLRADPVEDVRKNAEIALKELSTPRGEAVPEEIEEDAPSLSQDMLAALQTFKDAMQDGPP